VGRKTRTRWEATAMPWIAGAPAASERIYQSSLDVLPSMYSEHPSRPYMRKFADRIGDAELYWLSRTATTVVTDLAGHGMPPVTFRELIATSDFSASGLMLWPKPLAPLPWTNHRLQDPDARSHDHRLGRPGVGLRRPRVLDLPAIPTGRAASSRRPE
jgi:hypothetical protein